MKRKGQIQRRTQSDVTTANHTLQDRAFAQAPADEAQATKPSAHSFGSVPLHSAPIASTSGATPIIQRVVKPYTPKRKLPKKSNALKGLDDNQQEHMQRLHKETDSYTTEEARQLVGAPPLTQSTSNINIPLSFRYDMQNTGPGFMGEIETQGGLINHSQGKRHRQSEEDLVKIAIAKGITAEDLPNEKKRKIGQSKVMNHVSPNKAARALKLDCPRKLSWEWLHMVAFSIGNTHVSSLSTESEQLIKRTRQPQQITENLVLGSAAANTAMLTYETLLKQVMKRHPTWKTDLWVAVRHQNHTVTNDKGEKVQIPVALEISYQFFFYTDDKQASTPVIVTFSPTSHNKPSASEFEKIQKAMEELEKKLYSVNQSMEGINTKTLTSVNDIDDSNNEDDSDLDESED